MNAKEFNEQVNEGDTVKYKDDFGNFKIDTVKHPASTLGSGTDVMWLSKAGSYDLQRFVRRVRTSIDFSKHELSVVEEGNTLIHKLKQPDTVEHNIVFINTQDIMAVTGDFGNWIFCREFHPSADGYVSDGYWCEKLKIASSQEPYEYDPKSTREEIEERLSELEEGEEDIREYYNECLNYVDLQEWEYVSYAYNELPGNFCAEDVPFCKKKKVWLKYIFDGFEEICDRIKYKEKIN